MRDLKGLKRRNLERPTVLSVIGLASLLTMSGCGNGQQSSPASPATEVAEAQYVPLPKTVELDPPASASAAPTCDNRPANGARFAGKMRVAKFGHSIEVKNGTEGDAIVKIRDADSSKLMVSFFARQGETVKLKGVPDGAIRVQYAFGPELAADCKSFTETSASQFPDVDNLVTKRIQEARGVRVIKRVLMLTLYPVPGGSVSPEKLDAASFNAE